MRSDFRLLTLTAGLLLMAGTALADQEDIEDMIDAAFEAVEMTKYEQEGDDELTEEQEETVRRNTRRQIRRHFDRRGNPDKDADHFVNEVFQSDSQDFHDHSQTCPVCNSLVNSLLASTGIRRVPFYERQSCSPATHCFTPYGACLMGIASMQGSRCYCPSWQGPVWGQTGCM